MIPNSTVEHVSYSNDKVHLRLNHGEEVQCVLCYNFFKTYAVRRENIIKFYSSALTSNQLHSFYTIPLARSRSCDCRSRPGT